MPEAAKAADAAKVDQANPFNDPFTEELIVEFERLDKECESVMMAAMTKCKPHRKSQQELLDSAKDRGMNKKALKAHLKQRAFKRKAEAERDKLEDEDQDALDNLVHYLGQIDMFDGWETRAAAGTA